MTAPRRMLGIGLMSPVLLTLIHSTHDEFHERLLEAIRWINGQPR